MNIYEHVSWACIIHVEYVTLEGFSAHSLDKNSHI